MTTLPPKLHPSTRARLIAKLEADLALSRGIQRWAAVARAELARDLRIAPHEPARRRRAGRGNLD